MQPNGMLPPIQQPDVVPAQTPVQSYPQSFQPQGAPATDSHFAPNPYVQLDQQVAKQVAGFVPPKKQRSFPWMMVGVVLLSILLLSAIGFGVWAFMSRQDYKDNVDKKISVAVSKAKTEEAAVKDAEFVEKEKYPLKEYKGPTAFGGLSVLYPKTWSAFVTEQNSGTAVDGYFHPSFVPGLNSGTAFGLHVRVLSSAYSTEVKRFDSDVKTGKVTARPYSLPKVTSVVGVRIDGQLTKDQRGSTVLLPLRDKTIEITTQSVAFQNDLDNIILANLTFTP